MARFTEKYWNGKWWPRDEWDAMVAAQSALRPKTPYIISDRLDDVWNPATGKTYDSKSQYYRDVRAAGCEIVGNETMAPPKPIEAVPGVERDLKTAIEQLNARP